MSHFVFIFSLLFSIGSAHARGGSCHQLVTPAAKNNQAAIAEIGAKLNASLDQASTYFDVACKHNPNKAPALDPLVVQGLANKPSTDYLKTSIPFADLGGKLTQDFLRKILARIENRHQMNVKLAKKIGDCVETPKTSSCGKINQWLEQDLPQISALARSSLALSLPNSTPGYWMSKDELYVNSDLSEQKSFKMTKWNPLSKSELLSAKKDFDDLKSEAKRTAANNSHLSKKEQSDLYRRELTKLRHTHYMIYLSIMGINPILQFIKSENPSKKEISQAARQVANALEKEQESLSEIKNAIDKPYSVGRVGMKTFDDDVLNLLSYRTEVEEVLLENPEYCGLGLALKQIQDNKKSVRAIAGLPILAASLLIPPAYALYALGAGAVAAGYGVYESQKALSISTTQETARIQREGYTEFVQTLNSEAQSPGAKLVKIRGELQKDVTNIYRTNLQQVRMDETNRDINIALGPVVLISPVAIKYTAAQTQKLLSTFETAP